MSDLRSQAVDFGFPNDKLIPCGPDRLKVEPDTVEPEKITGRLIVVTGMTPSRRGGIGKTSLVLGLVDALNRRGTRAIASVRQIVERRIRKRGPANGALPRLVPEKALGSIAAQDTERIQEAQKLLAARVEDCIQKGQKSFDLSRRRDGHEHPGSSEIMAILALIQRPTELAMRIGQIILGFNTEGSDIRVRDLAVGPEIVQVLQDLLRPSLLRTAGSSWVVSHTGSFAHTSIGCSSCIADFLSLSTGAVCVCDTGHGSELGLEKFFNIKVRASGLVPERVIFVANIAAIREQDPGQDVQKGAVNLAAHIEHIQGYGYKPIIVLNRFEEDSEADVDWVRKVADDKGCPFHAVALGQENHPGIDELSKAISQKRSVPKLRYLYKLAAPLKEKIESIATGLYGAESVNYSEEALKALDQMNKTDKENFPVLFTKTPFSLSHEAGRKGRPQGFSLGVKDVLFWAGAGVVRVESQRSSYDKIT